MAKAQLPTMSEQVAATQALKEADAEAKRAQTWEEWKDEDDPQPIWNYHSRGKIEVRVEDCPGRHEPERRPHYE